MKIENENIFYWFQYTNGKQKQTLSNKKSKTKQKSWVETLSAILAVILDL